MKNELLEYLQKQKAEREAQIADYIAKKDEIAKIDEEIAALGAKRNELVEGLGDGNEEIVAEIAKIDGFIADLTAPEVAPVEEPAEEIGEVPAEEPVQETIEEVVEEPTTEEAPVFKPVE